MDDELKGFKTIDLRKYAASLGSYETDPKESTRSVAVMRRGADKIHVRLMPNGDFTWYSVRDDHGGSIIDFVQHREAIRNLGEVRKKLRAWDGRVSSGMSRPSVGTSVPVKDLARVRYVFSKMQIARRHPYLENERVIPRDLLASPRFEGRVRIGWKGCAVFPHFDQGGICGFEIRGHGFKVFASGGIKGLWQSHECPDDSVLVFCESAIDALSYAALFPCARARYASVAGQVTDRQRGLVRAAIANMQPDAEIVAAMDADEAGRKHSSVVREAFHSVGRPGLAFRARYPNRAKDWNDSLVAGPGPDGVR